MSGLTALQAREAVAKEHAERRNREAACRLNFLVHGDTFIDEDGEPTAHATVCVCSPTCSRDYDPLPYPEAEPADAKLYDGTAIGAMYGLTPPTKRRTWQDDDGNPVMAESNLLVGLAGWNLIPRSERYE